MTDAEMQERIEELELKVHKLDRENQELSTEIAEKIVECENLEAKVESLQADLKRERNDDKKYWDGYDACKAEYGFPDWDFMAYQKEMVRTAVDHIRTYDSLKGLSQ